MLAVLVLALVAVLAAALDQPFPPLAGRAQVSDGDSFRLGGDRIRLLGLDAPELAQLCDAADGSQWPCGRVARNRMAALLASGPLDCRPEDKDQYGRLLAICSLDGRDLGALLVGEGLALSAGRYWSEQEAARRQSMGIWVGGFETPRDWRDDQAAGRGLFGWLPVLDW